LHAIPELGPLPDRERTDVSDKCTTCGTSVVWATTRDGKQMPVNADPVDFGTVELHELPSGKVLATVGRYPVPGSPDRPVYVSHFATCPDANLHRRRTRSAAETSNPLAGWE
jgi:hypothetical protein